jgi:hypothetical protein
VALYGPAPPRVVQPKVQGGKMINLKPDMLKVCKNMTHCWSTSRQCTSPCIDTINPLDIRKSLDDLLCVGEHAIGGAIGNVPQWVGGTKS